MKRLLLAALLLVSGSVARAQMSAPTLKIDRGNAAQDFSATSAAKATLLSDLAAADTLSTPAIKLANPFVAPVVATALALPLDNAEPASPSPQPQFSGSSRNSYVIKVGGGADYRWNPRISFRAEGDYVRTGFFSQSQNNFQIAGGFVFHF